MAARPVAAHRSDGMAGRLATLALAGALLCGAAELLAGPAYRLGVLSLGAAIATMRWAAIGVLGVAALALVALLLTLRVRARRRTLCTAAAALVLAAATAAPPWWLYLQAQRLPRIHDISTDTADPPAFVAVLPLRAGARNPVDFSPATAAAQQAAYPDIAPLALVASPAEALERAVRAAHALGWRIVAVEPAAGRLEATDTTLLFGFEDDIVVRIRPAAGGSRVDVRSLSRIGGSDFGTNAGRVRTFLRRLQ